MKIPIDKAELADFWGVSEGDLAPSFDAKLLDSKRPPVNFFNGSCQTSKMQDYYSKLANGTF